MAQISIYDFTVKDNKGNDVSLAKYKGKVVERFEPTATRTYPCANCKLRANYEKNPKSFMGRFWRWHINFCPGWRGYFKSLDAESQQAMREKYDFKKYE